MQTIDTDLLDRISSDDDPIAYRQLVERHVNYAYALSFRLLYVRPLAECLVEEVLVATWSSRKARPWDAFGFSLWLYREIFAMAMSRYALLALRSHSVDAISEMPARHRAALTLIHLADMDGEKVAIALQMSKAATVVILAEGRRALRNRFEAVRCFHSEETAHDPLPREHDLDRGLDHVVRPLVRRVASGPTVKKRHRHRP